MKIKPLTGSVLVQLLPPPEKEGNIFLPEISAEAASSSDDPYRRKQARRGIVHAIGPWPKAKNGFAILPQFGIGTTVILAPHVGTKLNRNIGEHFCMVRNTDVLAVLTVE